MTSARSQERTRWGFATRLRRHVAALLCCCVTAGGCAYAPLRDTPPTPQPLPSDIAAYYDYPAPPRDVTAVVIREGRRFRELFVRFPLVVSGFEPTEPIVELEWFESTAPGRRPAILMNPILGGDYPLERGICRYFAARGFHVALIHRKTLKISPEHPASHLEVLLRQGVIRIRQAVDWMAAQERVDPARLGSFGISMGGMASVMAAAVEPRLRVHVIALAGGGIPDVLIASRDRLLTAPRQRYLARNHLDVKTLETLLRQAVKTDPIRLAPYVEPRALFMFVAVFDRTVGRANELRLWNALGRPRTVFIPTGHYTACLLLPYLKYQSLRFFMETLGT
ncbi:MAG: prolyl oligopeptidase family serine peptidase [Candidatus Omnitrophica bacterium]|nr:prolyl oligopeptidase family serine peptidase [Candidatus Omnitrophota bacterium]